MKDKIKSKKLISGYDSGLYKDLYNKTITEELSDNLVNFNKDKIR